MAKNDFQHDGWNSCTLQCGTIMTLISPGDCTLQRGMWLWDHAWQWIHQVAVGLPCNVTRGSGVTCHWIRPVAAPCNVACGFGIMTLNSPGGSTHPAMTCHWIRQNVRHIGILLVSISAISLSRSPSRHVIMHQSAKFYANRTTRRRK